MKTPNETRRKKCHPMSIPKVRERHAEAMRRIQKMQTAMSALRKLLAARLEEIHQMRRVIFEIRAERDALKNYKQEGKK